MSTTSFSFPIAKDIVFNLCRENFPLGNRYEVTITYTTLKRLMKFNRKDRNISFKLCWHLHQSKILRYSRLSRRLIEGYLK